MNLEQTVKGPRKSCRVLVIGQGAAGLTAAYAAAKHGAEVTSVSKLRPGAATCTIYAGGGFTLAAGGMSPEQHRKMTLETGRYLNVPELLDILASQGPGVVSLLEEIGVQFSQRYGSVGIKRDPKFPLLGGKPLIDALYRRCLDLGVKFAPNLAAVRLLVGERGVEGAEFIDLDSGHSVQVRADAVVLACGGAGALYDATDNPQRITGDGYRLALEASCHLMDMEFVQFYPIGIDIPGGSHWFLDLSIIDSARLVDSRGNEFLKDMLRSEGISSGREANLIARDRCAVAIALANRQGPVLLHLEDIPRDTWEQDRYLSSIAKMFPPSRRPWEGPVTVRPIQHYMPGGIVIGSAGETELPGLFAAGEVTGGVDGANRVGGNALTNCLVFGQRAGKAAADYGLSADIPPLVLKTGGDPAAESPETGKSETGQPETGQPETGQGALKHATVSLALPPIWNAKKLLSVWSDNAQSDSSPGKRPVTPAALRQEIRRAASENLSPVRDEEGLLRCIKQLESLGELLALQAVNEPRDCLLALENLGLWYTAAAIACSALQRRESRGPHYRLDFPQEDPKWQKHVLVCAGGGNVKASS